MTGLWSIGTMVSGAESASPADPAHATGTAWHRALTDPAVAALSAWRAAMRDQGTAIQRSKRDDDAALLAAEAGEVAAALRLAEVAPVSMVGIAAKLQFVWFVFGKTVDRADWHGDPEAWTDPRNCTFEGWRDKREAAQLRLLITGAERLAADAGEPVIAAF